MGGGDSHPASRERWTTPWRGTNGSDEKEWEHRFEPTLPAFVSMTRHGTSRLFLSEHTDDAGGPLATETNIYLRVQDVDAIAKEFDVQVIEQPWAREVWLTDLDGNRLRVGTPRT